jgi:hypothetical protein
MYQACSQKGEADDVVHPILHAGVALYVHILRQSFIPEEVGVLQTAWIYFTVLWRYMAKYLIRFIFKYFFLVILMLFVTQNYYWNIALD